MPKHINMKHSAENPDEPFAEYEVYPANMTDEELSELEGREVALKALKETLPMFYTVYGNVIPYHKYRITGKNIHATMDKIAEIKSQVGKPIVISTARWTITLNADTADQLRYLGQVEHLVLAGWVLT